MLFIDLRIDCLYIAALSACLNVFCPSLLYVPIWPRLSILIYLDRQQVRCVNFTHSFHLSLPLSRLSLFSRSLTSHPRFRSDKDQRSVGGSYLSRTPTRITLVHFTSFVPISSLFSSGFHTRSSYSTTTLSRLTTSINQDRRSQSEEKDLFYTTAMPRLLEKLQDLWQRIFLCCRDEEEEWRPVIVSKLQLIYALSSIPDRRNLPFRPNLSSYTSCVLKAPVSTNP